MKKQLLELLICPVCLPKEIKLQCEITSEEQNDIIEGFLGCPVCNTQYPIQDGVAFLAPPSNLQSSAENKYETAEVVSSYLWSHYGELFDDENSSKAYSTWSHQMRPHKGICLDSGGAVGRFAFEMSAKCDFAIGLDNSVAFIKTARELMKNREMSFALKEEGFLTKEAKIILPEEWQSDKVEFIVGDAMALPFKKDTISSYSSLNLIDKVPSPLGHLEEMGRVIKEDTVQFLLSDPFSWSTEAAEVEEWLGGKLDGPFAGKGLDNVEKLLSAGEGKLGPKWQVEKKDKVWWKIRTHTNHYELIQSCFIKASR